MNIPLLAAGVAASAAAQVVLKFAARFRTGEVRWFGIMAASAALYGVSFFLYSILLRKSDISSLSPVMAIAVMILVTLAGVFLFGERMDPRRILGVAVGVAAIALLSS